jgi:hypothetical protein
MRRRAAREDAKMHVVLDAADDNAEGGIGGFHDAIPAIFRRTSRNSTGVAEHSRCERR